MSDPRSDNRSQPEVRDTADDSKETRRFDSDQIRAHRMPRPGLVLRDRYRLDSELGRGAMGIVFRATDLELLRPVAVKVLAERLSGSTQEPEAAASGLPRHEADAADAGGAPAIPGKTAAGDRAGRHGTFRRSVPDRPAELRKRRSPGPALFADRRPA
jgi:hypothetical protein